MSSEQEKSNLAQEDTAVENKPLERPQDQSSSSSESSSSDGGGDPAYVPLAQSFPGSESSEEEEEGETAKDISKRQKKKFRAQGCGFFVRGVETPMVESERSRARKRRRFVSLKHADEPAHVRRQKREYYDSDNSYEALQPPPVKYKAETVDYYELAARPGCDEPIFNKIRPEEVSELIGYATDPKAQASMSVPAIFAGLPAALNDMSDFNFPRGPLLVPPAASINHTSGAVNPLLGLPSTPLPISHLQYISKVAFEGSKFSKEKKTGWKKRGYVPDRLEHKFSDSALVATGMLVEEMITASLMPLAGYHVMRCRELEARREKAVEEEDNDGSDKARPPANRPPLMHPVTGKTMQPDDLFIDPQEKPSEEWTLPIGEAMMKLLEQDVLPEQGLNLVPPATRTLGDPNRNAAEKEQHCMQLFGKDNKLNDKKLKENMDIYRLFVRMGNYKDFALNPPKRVINRPAVYRRRQKDVATVELDTDLEDAEEFDSPEEASEGES